MQPVVFVYSLIAVGVILVTVFWKLFIKIAHWEYDLYDPSEHEAGCWNSIKSTGSRIFHEYSVYSPAILHVLDSVSDYGVIYTNSESSAIVILTLGILTYRVVACVYIYSTTSNLRRVFFQFLDLEIIIVAMQVMMINRKSVLLQNLKKLESLFESFPGLIGAILLILQSSDSKSTVLWISIATSAVSIFGSLLTHDLEYFADQVEIKPLKLIKVPAFQYRLWFRVMEITCRIGILVHVSLFIGAEIVSLFLLILFLIYMPVFSYIFHESYTAKVFKMSAEFVFFIPTFDFRSINTIRFHGKLHEREKLVQSKQVSEKQTFRESYIAILDEHGDSESREMDMIGMRQLSDSLFSVKEAKFTLDSGVMETEGSAQKIAVHELVQKTLKILRAFNQAHCEAPEGGLSVTFALLVWRAVENIILITASAASKLDDDWILIVASLTLILIYGSILMLVIQGYVNQSRESKAAMVMVMGLGNTSMRTMQTVEDFIFSLADPNALVQDENILCYCCLWNLPAVYNRFLAYRKTNVNAVDAFGNSPLICASYSGNLKFCSDLILRGASVSHKNMSGQSSLHGAVMGGNSEIFTLLLSHTDLDLSDLSLLFLAISSKNLFALETLVKNGYEIAGNTDMYGRTMLEVACGAASDPAIVTILLRHRANVNEIFSNGKTSIITALYSGSEDIVKILLEHKAVLNLEDDRFDCVDRAISFPGTSILELLLSAKADVNKPSGKRKTTPLFACVARDDKKKVKLLLAHNADILAVSDKGNNCLMKACQLGYADMARDLIEAGIPISNTNEKEETALMLCCTKGHMQLRKVEPSDRVATIELLIAHKADINQGDRRNVTALHKACQKDYALAVQTLITHNADMECFEMYGPTPLTTACTFGSANAARVMLENKADVNKCKKYGGQTPLHCAISEAVGEAYIDVVKVLLEFEADVNLRDKKDRTALMNAVSGNHMDVATAILDFGVSQEEILKCIAADGLETATTDLLQQFVVAADANQ